MKRILTISLSLLLAVTFFSSCNKMHNYAEKIRNNETLTKSDNDAIAELIIADGDAYFEALNKLIGECTSLALQGKDDEAEKAGEDFDKKWDDYSVCFNYLIGLDTESDLSQATVDKLEKFGEKHSDDISILSNISEFYMD